MEYLKEICFFKGKYIDNKIIIYNGIVEYVRDVADIWRVFSQRDPGTQWSVSALE